MRTEPIKLPDHSRLPSAQVQKIALLSPAIGTGNVGDHFIETAVRRLLQDNVIYLRFTVREPLTEGDIDVINDCDCALVCGTNLYQNQWFPTLSPEDLARIQVPVIPFGVGSSAARLDETEVSRKTYQMIRELHSHCAVGGVRDPHSAEVVARTGVENFILTGCPVLFWARGAALPEIRPRTKRRILLTARNWLMHRWPDNVNHPVQIEFLRRILASFPPDRLVFAIHEDFDTRLVDILKIPRRMIFQSDRPEDYVSLYTEPDQVILSMRLHAGMLGLANGVPAAFIGHDTRTYSFCQMMGLEYIELFSEDAPERSIVLLRRLSDGDVTPFVNAQENYRELRSAMVRFLRMNGLPGWWQEVAAAQ